MMAFEQIPKKDWYSILGADPSASVSDLKQKYQKLILMVPLPILQLAGWLSGEDSACQYRRCNRHGFSPWVWRKKWQPTPVFVPGKSHGPRSLAGYSLCSHKELDMNEQYHPDKQSADAPAGSVEECIQKFIEIDQAWKILGNEETKKEYDLQRHDDHSFSLSCRCGGKYSVSKDEAEEVTLISCDTCSLIIELLHYR
ncbi:dnaJ homolog subfamily C member 24 isoform X2 [Muntiacus reevesi]|uniref:dnaJ homolog subfamily C member 24 isoform X2 n=1 Tax=Muntiacus reevesi TaxID=9886 RepID=UPI003306ACBD